jgi:inner membrane protein
MLALNHVTLSTAATFGLSLYLDQPFFLPFIIFVAFASLLPDVDHPKSEISNFFPGINKALPHRGVTHSIFGVGVFAVALYFLLQKDATFSVLLILGSFIGVYILSKIMTKKVYELNSVTKDFFSSKQMKFMIKSFSAVLYVFLAMLIFLIWKERFRLEIASLLTIGYIGHIIGDYITKDGIPLFWPLPFRPGLKLFRTGGGFESFLGLVLFVTNIYLVYLFYNRFGIDTQAYWQAYLTY